MRWAVPTTRPRRSSGSWKTPDLLNENAGAWESRTSSTSKTLQTHDTVIVIRTILVPLIPGNRILFQRRCRAPSDAGASSGNNDNLVVFSHHDFPPENVDLIRVYRSAGRLSIPIAGLWKSTGINLRKFLHSQCQSTLENETLRKYTILVMLYKFERALVYQLAVKDIPELNRAAGSKPYEDENEIR